MVVSRSGESIVERDACVARWDEMGVLHLDTRTVYINASGQYYVRVKGSTLMVFYDTRDGWMQA